MSIFDKATLICDAQTSDVGELARLAAPNDVNFFVGASLRGCDLRNSDLRKFELSEADFSGAIVSDSTLVDDIFIHKIEEGINVDAIISFSAPLLNNLYNQIAKQNPEMKESVEIYQSTFEKLNEKTFNSADIENLTRLIVKMCAGVDYFYKSILDVNADEESERFFAEAQQYYSETIEKAKTLAEIYDLDFSMINNEPNVNFTPVQQT